MGEGGGIVEVGLQCGLWWGEEGECRESTVVAVEEVWKMEKVNLIYGEEFLSYIGWWGVAGGSGWLRRGCGWLRWGRGRSVERRGG